MPYRAPDASAYTSMKKAIINQKLSNSLDENKNRAPSFYSSYTPYHSQNILRDGVYSNKFPIPPKQIVKERLVLYYDAGIPQSYPGFGNVVYDISPARLTQGSINGPTFSPENGGVFRFNGTNQFINAFGNTLASEEFTLNCWFRCSNVSTNRMMIAKQHRDQDLFNFRMYLSQGNGGLIGDCKPFMEYETGIGYFGKNLADGRWHMATFMRDVTQLKFKLFVEGDLVATVPFVQSAGITDSHEVWIGYTEYYGGLFPFLGDIGSVFIYHRALTDEEVKTNYEATKERFIK